MNIYELIKQQEQNLLFGKPIKIGKYAEHDHAEKVATIDAYLNSQHISGKTDSLDREKPFFNIGMFAAYTWYKLTDIDRKHFKFRPPNKSKRLKALIAAIKLRLWMNKKNFGAFLNKWGWTMAVYGSAVSKFVEKGGKLIPSVISWDRMICDPIDFNNNPKIEKIFFTPAQLRQQPYNQDKIEEAIECFKDARENIEGEEVDVANEYIGIYEVHGELPLSYLTNKEEDETTYRQQMHIVFIYQDKDKKDKSITLYSGKEAKDPYYLSHLIEQENRTLSIGSFETIFDAQWMVNDNVKKIKDQLDLSTKIALQTSDPQFTGRNYMKDWDTGQIVITKENNPLLPINTQSRDIPQVVSFLDIWKNLAREITGAHEAVTGQSLPSGTPYRLGMMLNTEARGLFDMMIENKALHLEEMLRIYVIPYFKKQLKDTEEIIALLDGEELEEFDELTLPARMEAELRGMLSVGIPTREDVMRATDQEGGMRVIRPSANLAKTWAEYFKDFEWDIEIDISGENRDKNSSITSLDTLLQRMLSAPQMFTPDDIRKVFNKLLDEIGEITPLHLSRGVSPTMGAQPMPGAEMPQMAGVGSVGMPSLKPTI